MNTDKPNQGRRPLVFSLSFHPRHLGTGSKQGRRGGVPGVFLLYIGRFSWGGLIRRPAAPALQRGPWGRFALGIHLYQETENAPQNGRISVIWTAPKSAGPVPDFSRKLGNYPIFPNFDPFFPKNFDFPPFFPEIPGFFRESLKVAGFFEPTCPKVAPKGRKPLEFLDFFPVDYHSRYSR